MRFPTWLLVSTAATLCCTSSHAQFEAAIAPAWQGATGTEFSSWDVFTSGYLGANLPDDPGTTSDDAALVQTTPGGIITSTNNLYNPDGASQFELTDSVTHDLLEVVLHTRSAIFGNPLDTSSPVLEYSLGGGPVVQVPMTLSQYVGGTTGEEFRYTWDLTSIADSITAYTIRFAASDVHCSLEAVRLDTRFDRPALSGDVTQLSLGSGGTLAMTLDAGVQNAGQLHLLLGSASGTTPAFPIDGVALPLLIDPYTIYTLVNANGSMLGNTLSTLSQAGLGHATVTLPAGSNPGLAGAHVDHAYLVFDIVGGTSQAVFASNASGIDLVL